MPGIKQVIALEDRTSGVLNKIEKQTIANAKAFMKLDRDINTAQKVMGELAARGQTNTTMFKSLQSATNSMTKAMDEYARGVRNAEDATKNLGKQKSIFPAPIKGLIGIRSCCKRYF